MKHLSFILVLVGLILLFGTQVETVSAGNNGQQIEIYGPYYEPPTRIVIEGKNQSNRFVTYDSRIHRSTRNVTLGTMDYVIYVYGWWWVDRVTVTVYWGNKSRTCRFNVPRSQPFWHGDWAGVGCLVRP